MRSKRITADWEYPLGKPSEEAIEKSIRLYLATIEICKEKNFSAISYKVVEGLPAHMGVVHSVPSALVASAGLPLRRRGRCRQPGGRIDAQVRLRRDGRLPGTLRAPPRVDPAGRGRLYPACR